jgi:hypothetical protein
MFLQEIPPLPVTPAVGQFPAKSKGFVIKIYLWEN